LAAGFAMQTTPTADTNVGVIIYLGALITYLSAASERGVCVISGMANNGNREQFAIRCQRVG